MDLSFLILIVVLLGLMFFMTSRQRKQQREAQAFRNELAPGQEVMTGSGMFGTIVEVDEANDIITIESTPGTRSRWLRAAIAKRVDAPADTAVEAGDTDPSASAGTIAPAGSSSADVIDVPDDISGLDTAQREYRDQQRKADGDAEGK
ncbi:preprotein translocase subunit YajC [Puerhibacterium puerhi]|uniref:preprotein translocase subunit YajC n=1 Tax=Puerhibacterium puerhi TaxID=2692623 RepID=UPI001F3265FC|nr:preprotein translocase subunit YajC [Puerhibacterium puerhi]